MIIKPCIALALMIAAAPAAADQRDFSVTSFTRIRIEGPIKVTIATGGSPKAEARGDRRAIDRIRIETSGDLLSVGIDRTNWTGESDQTDDGRAEVLIGAQSIESLSIIGAGDVAVNAARSTRFRLVLTGPGKVAIKAMDVTQLTATINGNGMAQLAGHAVQARIASQGSGAIDATALDSEDADVTLIGAGEIKLKARRTAHATLKGSGRILISGSPACTMVREGSGELTCGSHAQ